MSVHRFRLSLVLIITVALIGPTDAFIGNIGQTIVDGIKSAFWGAVYGIGSAIKNFILWSARTIKSAVLYVAADMVEAVSAAGSAIRQRASSNLDGVFGVFNTGQRELLIQMMSTAPLPKEYYLRPFDLDGELAHLDALIDFVLGLSITALCFVSLVTLGFVGLFALYRSMRHEQEFLLDFETNMESKLKEALEEHKKLKFAEL
ncbi:uncharacterized protein LOC131887346 [Tigriopus californicus]|uniref:uncharacterized protein LOC131887346 n=1 Tax=Tigriopus californicus TaxID=6832 RepID=UPI0027DA26D5|nr:uncharacterized protein LOC131887346 [Tigriopus californicus]